MSPFISRPRLEFDDRDAVHSEEIADVSRPPQRRGASARTASGRQAGGQIEQEVVHRRNGDGKAGACAVARLGQPPGEVRPGADRFRWAQAPGRPVGPDLFNEEEAVDRQPGGGGRRPRPSGPAARSAGPRRCPVPGSRAAAAGGPCAGRERHCPSSPERYPYAIILAIRPRAGERLRPSPDFDGSA